MAWYACADTTGAKNRIMLSPEAKPMFTAGPATKTGPAVVTALKDGNDVDFSLYKSQRLLADNVEGNVLKDYFCVRQARVVSCRFKDLIERFEPDRHAFLEIPEISTPDGVDIRDGRRFYFINIRRPIDAIEFDNSKGISVENVKGVGEFWLVFIRKSTTLTLCAEKISGRSIWLGGKKQRMPFDHFYMSDEFYGALKEQAISGISAIECEEI